MPPRAKKAAVSTPRNEAYKRYFARYQDAVKRKEDSEKSVVMRAIAREFSLVYDDPQLLEISADDFRKILSDFDFRASDERHVLTAALKWLNHAPDRLQHADEVLSRLRLPMIDLSEEEVENLKKEPAFNTDTNKRRLEEACSYRTSPADIWWMKGWNMTPRKDADKQEVLGIISMEHTLAMNNKQKWRSMKNKFFKADNRRLDTKETSEGPLDLVAYGDIVYMAAWNTLHRLFRCSEFPSGLWHEVAPLPQDGQQRSLIAVPDYLYMFGTSKEDQTPMYRLKLPSGSWEDAPPAPHAVSFACCFYYDRKVYLFDQTCAFNNAYPEAIRGLHVFDLVSQTWKNMDDPVLDEPESRPKKRANISYTESKKGIHHFKMGLQRPPCVDGTVTMTTRSGVCYYNVGKREMELDDGTLYSANSAVGLSSRMVYFDCGYVYAMEIGFGKVSLWNDLSKYLFDGEPIVAEVPNDRLLVGYSKPMRASRDCF